MSRLFNRQCRLTVVKPNGFFGPGENAVIITGLRVSFSIEKTLEETPNTAQISIFNLAEQTRVLLAKKPLRVILEVGYPETISQLFVGDVRFVEPKRHSVDWETILQLGDGHRAFSKARITRSFSAGTDVNTLVKEVASSMGLTVPKDVTQARELASRIVSGVAMQGPSEQELSKVLKARGLSWSIQDGRLQILAPNGVRRDQAIVISQNNAMVGTPEIGAPKEEGAKAVLTVRTLIDPRIFPGGRIILKSTVFDGKYRVVRVVHSGDTHGNEWYSTVEATPL